MKSTKKHLQLIVDAAAEDSKYLLHNHFSLSILLSPAITFLPARPSCSNLGEAESAGAMPARFF